MPEPHACGQVTSRKRCIPSPCQRSCALPDSCDGDPPSRARQLLHGAFRRGRGGAGHSVPAAFRFLLGQCRCRRERGQTPAPEGDAGQRRAPCGGNVRAPVWATRRLRASNAACWRGRYSCFEGRVRGADAQLNASLCHHEGHYCWIAVRWLAPPRLASLEPPRRRAVVDPGASARRRRSDHARALHAPHRRSCGRREPRRQRTVRRGRHERPDVLLARSGCGPRYCCMLPAAGGLRAEGALDAAPTSRC